MDVPKFPDEIDADWLNGVFAATGDGFEAVEVTPMGADTGMYGQLARVRARRRGGRVDTFVAKFASASAENRRALGQAGVYRNEYLFYTRMADGFPIRVPHCHFAHYEPMDYGTLLLLEALDGTFGDDVRGASRIEVELALDAAANMHRHWAEPGRLAHHDWLVPIPESDLYRSFATIDADHARRALAVIGDRLPDWLRSHAMRTGFVMQSQLGTLGIPARDAVPRIQHGAQRAGDRLGEPGGGRFDARLHRSDVRGGRRQRRTEAARLKRGGSVPAAQRRSLDSRA